MHISCFSFNSAHECQHLSAALAYSDCYSDILTVILYSPHFFSISNSSVEFFCKEDLSPCIYLFRHLFMSVWTHGYLFYSWVIIHYCYYLFCFSFGNSSRLALMSFWHRPPSWFGAFGGLFLSGFVFKHVSAFYKMLQAHLIFSQPQPQNQPFSQWALQMPYTNADSWFARCWGGCPETPFRPTQVEESDSWESANYLNAGLLQQTCHPVLPFHRWVN